MKNAKYISFGIEPIAGFIFAKETELRNLRIIITSKLAKLGQQTIKERLRETYV
jgi:V/A-type H+-transporting ATPase subunit C